MRGGETAVVVAVMGKAVFVIVFRGRGSGAFVFVFRDRVRIKAATHGDRHVQGSTGLTLAIHFSAVSDAEDSYALARIINFIDHSIVPDPNSSVILGTG